MSQKKPLKIPLDCPLGRALGVFETGEFFM